jgi:hypothetical protein
MECSVIYHYIQGYFPFLPPSLSLSFSLSLIVFWFLEQRRVLWSNEKEFSSFARYYILDGKGLLLPPVPHLSRITNSYYTGLWGTSRVNRSQIWCYRANYTLPFRDFIFFYNEVHIWERIEKKVFMIRERIFWYPSNRIIHWYFDSGV